MSDIKRAVVKSYDAAAHKADVQIAGSLAVWLDAVRVATDIPAADVVAGRQCTVLFLDPSNQDDAVVITVQGALPSVPSAAAVAASATVVTETSFGQAAAAGSASPYSRGDHTHGTPADPVPAHAAHSDPHTVYGALAQAETWAALQTFNAGLQLAASQAIKDSGGTDRITLATTNPHVTLGGTAGGGGGVRINDRMGIGGVPASTVRLRIIEDDSFTGARFVTRATLAATLTGNSANLFGTEIAGISDMATYNLTRARGLSFTPGIKADAISPGTLAEHSAIYAHLRYATGGGGAPHITDAHVAFIDTPTSGASDFLAQVAHHRGIRIANQGVDPYFGTPFFHVLSGAIDIEAQADAATNYTIRAAGVAPSYHQPFMTIGAFGPPIASAVLELRSTTGALVLPRMTTTQRNALTAVNGMVIYNTTTNVVEAYENGAWVNV